MFYVQLLISFIVLSILGVDCKRLHGFKQNSGLHQNEISGLNEETNFINIAEKIVDEHVLRCDILNGRFMLDSRLITPDNIEENVNIYVYSPNGFHLFLISEAPTSLLESEFINPLFDTIIFVHGFNNTPYQSNIEMIAQRYSEKGNFNFLSFDTYRYTHTSYPQAVALCSHLGEILGKFIVELLRKGVLIDKLHLIGFSLGSHIAGISGLYLQKNYGMKLPRITGLEPPSLCFSSRAQHKLSQRDAKYVDVIHTSFVSLRRGNVGHADYYVNGNSGRQPGCEETFINCSHGRSMLLYAESLQNEMGFPALQCADWSHFLRNNCPGGRMSIMGYASPNASRGAYYVRTESFYPFSLVYKGFYKG